MRLDFRYKYREVVGGGEGSYSEGLCYLEFYDVIESFFQLSVGKKLKNFKDNCSKLTVYARC